MAVVHDIRAYYEEPAVALADGPPGAWAAERWFYDETEAGQAILKARRAMKEAEAPFAMWFYMAPGARARRPFASPRPVRLAKSSLAPERSSPRCAGLVRFLCSDREPRRHDRTSLPR